MIKRILPTAAFKAAINSNSPSDTNPFATIADVIGINIVTVPTYSALPAPATVTNKYYRTLVGENSSWRPAWLGGTYYPEGIYFSDGSTWDYVGEFPYQEDQAGVDAGLNNKNFVTPVTLKNAAQWNTKFDVPTGAVTDYLDGTGAPQPFPTSSLADGDYGDITISGSGSVFEVDPLAITDSKINDVAAAKVTETTSRRFVSDAEKTTWNNKQDALGFTPENLANKGIANGYAGLDASSKLPALNSRPSGVIYNTVSGELTFTWADGSTQTIDLPIENLLQSASYNSTTQILTVTTNGGGTIDISLATLVDLPEIEISASSDPSLTPSTGKKLYFRVDNGAYWMNQGGSWVGGYLGVTITEKNTWSSKQDLLISATNIKTVGGVSLLGSGDIPLPSGSGLTFQESLRLNTIL